MIEFNQKLIEQAIDSKLEVILAVDSILRRSINDSVTSSSRVNRADIALNGFQLDYVNSDHHINVVEIDTDITGRSHNTVNFRVEADYADKNFDDRYRG